MKRKGFTLIEMLVVIGIIATLMGVAIASLSKVLKSAEKARCQELVANTATALTALFQKEGAWPKLLIDNNNESAGLDNKAALPLAKGGYMTLTTDNEKTKSKATELAGYDRFGIVTPWALSVIKGRGSSVSLETRVPRCGTIQHHVLCYALDLDGDGIIEGVSVGGESIDIRATAAVWWCALDPSDKPYSYTDGLKKGSVYSWTIGQTRRVK